MLKFLYFRHTTWRKQKKDFRPKQPPNLFLPGPPHCTALHKKDYLHDVELRQQVAVSQSKLLAVQEGAGGGSDFISAILVDLIRKWGTEVVIQLLQSLQQTFL